MTDSNATTRADAAHDGTQDRGALIHRLEPCPELIGRGPWFKSMQAHAGHKGYAATTTAPRVSAADSHLGSSFLWRRRSKLCKTPTPMHVAAAVTNQKPPGRGQPSVSRTALTLTR
jgi:hypothetical protein